MIGHEVVLTVLEVRGDVVRIGIKAPRDLDVHREEVFLELQLANRGAASPSAAGIDTLLASSAIKPHEVPEDPA
jgi:carbon storage regulator